MPEIETFKAAIFISGFLLFSCLQYFFPYIKQKKHGLNLPNRTITNLLFFATNFVVTILFVNLVIKYFSINQTVEHSFIYYTCMFLILDIALYFWHRLNHVTPFLWRFHKVHHLDSLLSTTTAFRFHPVEIIVSPLFKLTFIWSIGIPLEIIIIHTSVVNLFSLYEHSNINIPTHMEKLISMVFITPNIHKIHHTPSRKYTDSNYGTIFTLWDKLFNTFNNAKHTGKFGINDKKQTEDNFKNLLLAPFKNN